MAFSIKIFLSCLFLFLLTTLKTADAFVKPKGEQTTSAHQGTVPKVKHDTNLVQTWSIRRPPSGPNPEGNFEVNAASQDVGKRGAKVQNVDAEFVTKKKLTRVLSGNVASKDVDKHELHTTGLRRPPSGPNPEGNFEVNAASQDIGKRGAKLQNVDVEFVTKKKLTRTITGNVASKDDRKHELHTTGLRRPPSGPNPEGNFEVNAASQDVGKRGAKVQYVDEASKELTGSTQG